MKLPAPSARPRLSELPPEGPRYVAFAGVSKIAEGTLPSVVRVARFDPSDAPVRVFDQETGEEVDLDLAGFPRSVAAAPNGGRPDATRAPGRPKLGVVSKEVTLLPRQWAWLAAQRGSTSATLRRLIDEARHLHDGKDAVTRAQDSAYRFISVMADDQPTFDEAIRALYRGDAARFDAESAPWPPDIRDHARMLAAGAFPPGSGDQPAARPDR